MGQAVRRAHRQAGASVARIEPLQRIPFKSEYALLHFVTTNASLTMSRTGTETSWFSTRPSDHGYTLCENLRHRPRYTSLRREIAPRTCWWTTLRLPNIGHRPRASSLPMQPVERCFIRSAGRTRATWCRMRTGPARVHGARPRYLQAVGPDGRGFGLTHWLCTLRAVGQPSVFRAWPISACQCDCNHGRKGVAGPSDAGSARRPGVRRALRQHVRPASSADIAGRNHHGSARAPAKSGNDGPDCASLHSPSKTGVKNAALMRATTLTRAADATAASAAPASAGSRETGRRAPSA